MIDKGINIARWVDDILKKIELVTEESVVRLTNPSVSEIGFKDGVKLSEIYKKASSQQLRIVHPQVALEFLLWHGDGLEVGQWIILAMEPITDSVGALVVLRVGRHSGSLWLSASFGRPDDFWDGVNQFFFSVAN